MPIETLIRGQSDLIELADIDSLENFAARATTAFTDDQGRHHIIYFPNSWNVDSVNGGLHFLYLDNRINLLERIPLNLSHTGDLELVKNDFGYTTKFFIGESGPEYADSDWPGDYIYEFSIGDDGRLAWQKVSDIRAFNHGLAIDDINNDGAPDVVAQHMGSIDEPSHAEYEKLHLWVSGSSGYTLGDLDFDPTGGFSGGGSAVNFVDVDRDGTAELLQGAYALDAVRDWGGLRIWSLDRNLNLNFQQQLSREGDLNTSGITSIDAADLDSDGDLDLLLSLEGVAPWKYETETNDTQNIQIWKNQDGQFNFFGQLDSASLINRDMREARVLDVNFDGMPDIIRQRINTGDEPSFERMVYTQNTIGQFAEEDFSQPWLDQIDGHMFTRVTDLVGVGPSLISFFKEGTSVSSILWSTIANEPVDIEVTGLRNTVFGSDADDIFVVDSEATGNAIDGGSGIDRIMLNVEKFDVNKFQDSYSVLENAIVNVERIEFSNANLALDLNGSAGQTAKTLAAVLGSDSLSNKEYVSLGLQLFDAGQSLETVCGLALQAAGATTNEQVVNTLYSNLYGESPTAELAQPFVDALNAGAYSQGFLAAAAAELTDDLGVIDLVGLAETGIEYA